MINKAIRRIDILAVVTSGNIIGSRSVGAICLLNTNELNVIAILKYITPTE